MKQRKRCPFINDYCIEDRCKFWGYIDVSGVKDCLIAKYLERKWW